MSEPKFNGFVPPTQNWSKLPHQLIDALHLIETEAEIKVILYILRHTWGYHDEEKKITMDEFCNGRKRQNGTRIDNGTGLTKNAVKDGINRAIEHGFIDAWVDASDAGRIKKYYRLSEVTPQDDDKIGGQSLTPGWSEVDPGGSEVDPRTEKETQETNLRENTHPDFLDDVFEKQDTVNENTAPNPQEQWFEYSSKALKIFQQKLARYPNEDEKTQISALVDEIDFSMRRWKQSLSECNLNYSGQKCPLTRVIEVYRAGGTWTDWQKWKDKQNDNGNTNSGNKLTPEQEKAYQKLRQGKL
jgi:hypothetical protein